MRSVVWCEQVASTGQAKFHATDLNHTAVAGLSGNIGLEILEVNRLDADQIEPRG